MRKYIYECLKELYNYNQMSIHNDKSCLNNYHIVE